MFNSKKQFFVRGEAVFKCNDANTNHLVKEEIVGQKSCNDFMINDFFII